MLRALLLSFIAMSLSAADDTSLRAMLEAHHWFDLHDAVSEQSPLFYRLAAAAAFNDIRGAEKAMTALEKSGANRDQISGAHQAMAHLYRRNGFYRRAGAEVRKFATPPAQGESNADWGDMEAMEKLPDTAVVSRRPGTVDYTLWPNLPYLVAPLSVNGRDAQYLMDTGASMSMVTESEAKRLGLNILQGTPVFDGITGERGAQGHYAYAARLKIANTELRNIAFVVLPDNVMDLFEKLPQKQRGVIGMPVLLAIGSVRWNRDGRVTFGFAAGRQTPRGKLSDANIAFDGLVPLTNWEIAKHRLAVELDTGSDRSFVWPRYVMDFPDLIPDLPEGKTGLNGSTGGTDVRSLTLPELRLRVGGFEILFAKAPALLQSTIPASSFLYGLLGKDQLDKAQEVSIDLRAMTLALK